MSNEKTMKDNLEGAKMLSEKMEEFAPDFPPEVKSTAVLMTAMGCEPDSIINVMSGMLGSSMTAESERKHPAPEIPTDYSPVERALMEMLIENTGCAIGDNAGYCGGRNWEHNRAIKDFRALPRYQFEVADNIEDMATEMGGVSMSMSLFHYLQDVLEVDEDTEKLQKEFDQWSEDNDDWGLSAMEGWLKERGDRMMFVENTYNDEYCVLDQVIQYAMFSISGEHYVLLQVHGGADLRGGYSDPKVFKCCEDMLSPGDGFYGRCDCTEIEHEGYHWREPVPKSWVVVDDGNYKRHIHCEKCGKDVLLE